MWDRRVVAKMEKCVGNFPLEASVMILSGHLQVYMVQIMTMTGE